MDFNAFDSVTAAEKGGRLHLKHILTGEPMGEGENAAIVFVKGTESTSFQAEMKALNAAKIKGDGETDEKSLSEIHAEMVVRAKSLITGFENVSNGKVALTGSDADIEWFLNLQKIGMSKTGKAPTFIEQVVQFARDRGNYLGNE